MTNTVQARYRKAVASNLKPFYANWMPGQARALGDYGTFEDGIFERLGNVRDFGLDFAVRTDDSGEEMRFCADGSYDFKVDAGADVSIANVGATLSLNGSNSVFFQALGTRTNEMADKTAFGRALVQAYEDEKIGWERSWVVITELVEAGRTIAAVATSNGAKVEFKAKVDVPIPGTIISDPRIGLDVQSTRDVGFHICGDAMQVLIGLSKIKGWWNLGFRSMKSADGAEEMELVPYTEEV
jgi:hypothetical protein